jgi:hypothetical protein
LALAEHLADVDGLAGCVSNQIVLSFTC